MEAITILKEKTNSVEKEGKKTTYILDPLAPEFIPRALHLRARSNRALPVEVLVKIFNYLPNRDIRCGISLVCKEFYKISRDDSLVPVKDLCIYGQPVGRKSKKKGQKGKQCFSLKNIGAVSDVIAQSKNLTFLKIKALSSETVNELVSIALQSCPQLMHLTVIENPQQSSKYFGFFEKYIYFILVCRKLHFLYQKFQI